MIPSFKAARATGNLTVEHGMNPLAKASFWFTMLRIRPVLGSATSTAPFNGPNACTAAWRTVRSSPSTKSPAVDSPKDDSVQRCTAGALATGRRLRLVVLSGVFDAVDGVESLRLLVDFRTVGRRSITAAQPTHTKSISPNKRGRIYLFSRL